MKGDARRFIFSGHAIGAAARFHKLDKKKNLDYHVDTLGASVLPPTGGNSKSHVSNFAYQVSHPRRRILLSAHHIETSAHGRVVDGRYETEVEATLESVSVLDKLHFGNIRVHILATRDSLTCEPVSSSTGNKLEEVQFGRVKVKLTLDEELLCHCGSADALKKYVSTLSPRTLEAVNYKKSDDEVVHTFTLVREVKLSGPAEDVRKIHREGSALRWEGVGKIYLAEVSVVGLERQVTMVRLELGSDDGAGGTMGDGKTNGHVGTG